LPYLPIDLRGAALALLVSLFWGANPVAIKLGLTAAPPLRLGGLRFLVGGLVVALWAWRTGRLRGLQVEPHEWRPLAILGLLLTAQIALMNIGTGLTSAARAAVFLNMYAVHTVVLAHFLVPGDRLTVRRLAGTLVAYGGIVVLFGRRAAGDAVSPLGDGLVFASGLLLAERTVYLARAVQSLDPVKLLLAQALAGTAMLALLSALLEPEPTRWTAALGASLAFQGVVVAGFNFIVNLWLLRRHRPSALAAFFLTQPIFGVLVAAAVAGEPITADLLLASAAVAVGIGLSGR
jgi:drug/metabolite transporter (DMT)-like permease